MAKSLGSNLVQWKNIVPYWRGRNNDEIPDVGYNGRPGMGCWLMLAMHGINKGSSGKSSSGDSTARNPEPGPLD